MFAESFIIGSNNSFCLERYLLATAPHNANRTRNFWKMATTVRPMAIVVMDSTTDRRTSFTHNFWPTPGRQYDFTRENNVRWLEIGNRELLEEVCKTNVFPENKIRILGSGRVLPKVPNELGGMQWATRQCLRISALCDASRGLRCSCISTTTQNRGRVN